jgi:hypothetical protein
MFCRNCGKEFENTVKFCPYCGSPISEIKTEEKLDKNENSQLNEKLVSFIDMGNGQQAIKYYQEITGKSLDESALYVGKIKFLRTHKLATEDEWDRELLRRQAVIQQGQKQQKRSMLIVVFSIIFTILTFVIAQGDDSFVILHFIGFGAIAGGFISGLVGSIVNAKNINSWKI